MSLYTRDTSLWIGVGDREWDGVGATGDRKQGMGKAWDRG